MTNYEKIKQMSVEELSNFLLNIANCCFDYGADYEHCIDCPLNNTQCGNCRDFLNWLESKADTE